MQSEGCPSDAELVSLRLHSQQLKREDLSYHEALSRHVQDCVECKSRLTKLMSNSEDLPTHLTKLTLVDQMVDQSIEVPSQTETRPDSEIDDRARERVGTNSDSIDFKTLADNPIETRANQTDDQLQESGSAAFSDDSREPAPRTDLDESGQASGKSRYEVRGEIARGAMGAILKGRDNNLGRDLAIKILLDRHRDNPRIVQRFIEEAQIGGQLQHPGIAPVYELGQFEDKRPFFSMKLVKGDTLSSLLKARADTEDERGKFLNIFEQICQTVGYAHSRDVIHRDLKPSNIMVGAFGEVQVMDWGLAKVLSKEDDRDEQSQSYHQNEQSVIATRRSGSGFGSELTNVDNDSGSETQMGTVLGTPGYMPPEQALGEIDNLDERVDVFGLGAILCEILTGRPPYVGGSANEVLRLAARGKLDACFERLEASRADHEVLVLAKDCLAPDPDDRPRSAGEVASRISGYLESVQERLRESELKRATQSARAEEERKRRRVSLALTASVLIMAMMGSVGWFYLEYQDSLRQAALLVEKTRYAEEMRELAAQRDGERIAANEARSEADARRRDAEAQREAAEEVAAFLGGLFQDVDPIARTGRPFGAQKRSEKELTALEVVQRGSEKLKTSLRDKPKLRAELLDRIGNVYLSLDRVDEAAPLLEEAYQLRLEHCGEESPETAASIQSLGLLKSSRGRMGDAMESFEQALLIRRKTLKQDDPRIANTLFHLGTQQVLAGIRVDQAENHLLECLSIRRNNYPEKSLEVANVSFVLALTYLDRNEIAKAIPLLQKSAATFDELQGNHGFSEIILLFSQARLMEKLGIDASARSFYEQMEERAKAFLGDDHQIVAFGRFYFAMFLINHRQTTEGIAKLQQVIRVYRNSFGPHNPTLARRLIDLARAQRRRKEIDLAEEALRESIEIFEGLEDAYGSETYQSNALHHAIALHIQGAIKDDLGHRSLAKTILCNGIRILDEHSLRDSLRMRMMLHDYACILNNWPANPDLRDFRNRNSPSGDSELDVELAEKWALAAALQRQQPQENRLPNQQLAVLLENQAIKFLQTAKENGFQNLMALRDNPSFEAIWERPEFLAMTEATPTVASDPER